MRHLASLLTLLLMMGCSPPPAAPSVTDPSTVRTDTPPVPQDAIEDPSAPASGRDAAASCDWSRRALPEHRDQVNATPGSLLRQLDAASDGGEQVAALLRRPAQPPGDIVGAWRVRSLQVASGGVYAYPFFDARIDADACGYRFAKTSGSQRRNGVLHPVDGTPQRLAFLGAATINDAPPRDYDPARPASDQHPGDANSAGWLTRIGPDELLMVLDAGPETFEVYHLRR